MVNKIIGALVILAIGILISPFIFTHHTQTFLSENIKEPPFPEQFSQNDTIRALKEEDNSWFTVKAKQTLLKYSSIKNNLSVPELKHVKTKDQAWVVQIGNFRNKVDAFRLVNKLRSRGYNAFIHQKNAAFGAETKVYIGPEGKRDSAELLATRLSKEDRVSGVIKSFKPLTT